MTPTKSFDELRPLLLKRYQQLQCNPATDAAYNAAVKLTALLQSEALQTPLDAGAALRTLLADVSAQKQRCMQTRNLEWHEYWTAVQGHLEYALYDIEHSKR